MLGAFDNLLDLLGLIQVRGEREKRGKIGHRQTIIHDLNWDAQHEMHIAVLL